MENTSQPEQAASGSGDQPADRYGIVEIFGHRRHAGRILEVEQFGSKMLRIDVPTDGDFEKGYTSHFYGGAAIFGLVDTDLATVLKANRPYQPALPYRSRPDEDDE